MSRSTVTLLLKSLVSLGILVFLLSRIDTAQLLRVLGSAHLSYFLIGMAGYFLGQIVCSVRWALLARPLGFENAVKDFAILYFIGMFFNLFAPSTIGGDVGRVFYLARDGHRREEPQRSGAAVSALISVLADRLIGLAVLVWIGAAALALFSNYAIPMVVRAITFALAAGSILGWLSLSPLYRLAQRWDIPRGKNLLQGLVTYAGNHRIIALTLVISLVAHFIQSWMQILLGHALGVEIPWSYSFILYPLVGVFSALPISLNGIGLREGGYLYLLQQIEIAPLAQPDPV
ncbi:MAG: flippase-like domain-containing protein [Deltaproteobacteria bacterium]|nr:flippase-like domain-containing protein [Deltaproteobacteria bacterium]